jgi:pimeloyl-ACP methyl ester carboxylesterase
MTTAIRHDYADVNGVRLHYAAAGAGPLVMFLHGFPEFWYEWHRQLEEFGRDHTAVAPDLRGHNLSSKPEGLDAYRVEHLVADVAALGAHLGHRRFTLVAHDWGGAVAWAVALRRPDVLERLVIINAPHPAVFARELRENPAQQQASQYMLMFRTPQAEEILSADDYAALRRGLGEVWDKHFTDEDRRMYLEAWSRPGALTCGLNYYRAARVGPPSGTEAPSGDFGVREVPVIDTPTLVIWGERDRALGTGNLVGLDKHVRSLTIRRIPEGSHWVVHEQPELINRYIREFLTSWGAPTWPPKPPNAQSAPAKP